MKKYRKTGHCLIWTLITLMFAGCGTENGLQAYVPVPEDLQTSEASAEVGEINGEAGSATESDLQEAESNNTDANNLLDSENGINTDKQNSENEGEEEPKKPEIVTLTISAAGDVTLGNMHLQGYEGTFRQMYDKQQNPGYFFENVKPIFEADDMTIVNFEGVLTLTDEKVEKQYNMKGDPEYAFILPEGSVEAVSLGNNHHMDYGQAGHDDTVAALEDAGIAYACDAQTGIYSVKGITVGFVSVNVVYDGAAVEKYLQEGIAALKEQGASLIIACCHWGTETHHNTDPYQEELGRKCIDWGADLVLGHHPHVLQGIEEYNGKYIVYSLGNFCFGGNRNPKDKDTMIFQQTFTFTDGVKEESGDIRIIPCSISSVSSRNNYQPTPAVGEEAERIITLVNEYSEPFAIKFDMDGYIVQEVQQ